MSPQRITSYNLKEGRRIGNGYVVEHRLGGGSEGEVYRVRERRTGIVRAAKIYFPHDDPKGQMPARRAQKLEALRDCPIVLQYFHTEEIRIGRRDHGDDQRLLARSTLQEWMGRYRGRRVPPFVALTILHRLVSGLEDIHERGEYHADVHSENILIRQTGIDFELKLIDFYDWGGRAARSSRTTSCTRSGSSTT